MDKNTIDYAALIEEHKGLIEAMAWVALSKIRRPSSIDFDDLCQEGAIVCLEWVQRWYNPSKGASIRTFITGGLRNHFTDLVRRSFRDYPDTEKHEIDLMKRSVDRDPCDIAMFNETMANALSSQHKEYIHLFLEAAQSGPKPREVVREKMGISISTEEAIRKEIRVRLANHG